MDKKLPVARESVQPQHCAVAVCHGYENLPQEYRYSWYWSRNIIENCSPSRTDGIDLAKESQLRMVYCSFIHDIGTKLRVPQVTIATAIIFCHRFYLHQSHAKNEWQTIATVCMFLASKVEDTPCHLNKVVKIAYETMYQSNYVAAQRINKKEVFEKQKSLILLAEKLVLCTIRYDFDVRHPYKPLVEALKKLKIDKKDVRQTAWNFVNDWLRTTICLQFEPKYVAVGSLYLSAKHHNVKLPPGDNGCSWWQVLNAVPYKLQDVLDQMKEVLSSNQKQVAKLPPKQPKQTETPVVALVKQDTVLSPDSCVSAEDTTLAPESTTSSAKFGNPQLLMPNGTRNTRKNSMQNVISVPEPTATNAKLNGKDQCEKGISEGLNVAVKNRMDHVSSVPESITSSVKRSRKDQCEIENSEGLNGTVKICIEIQLKARKSDGQNGYCMEDISSIPKPTTSNAEVDTKYQCETVISIPEPVISTPKVKTENRCGTKESNRVDGTVKSGLENEVENALKSLLDMDKIKALMNRRKRNRNVRERAISLESLNDDELIERELENGIVLTKRPKPCKDLVSL